MARTKCSEASEQAAVIQWANLMTGRWPELRWLYHVPNGGSRNRIEAVHLKQQGVRAGIPDLHLPVPRGGYHGLFVEMKYGRNKPTAAQAECLQFLAEHGYRTAVCYSADEAIQTITDYIEEQTA